MNATDNATEVNGLNEINEISVINEISEIPLSLRIILLFVCILIITMYNL